MAFGAFWGGWGAVLPAVKETIGATDRGLGFAVVAVAVGALPAMLAAGRAIDRFGGRTIPWTLVGFAAAALLPALATSTVALAAAMLVLGAASGALDVSINSGVSALERELSGRFFNQAHGAFALGSLVTAVAVGLAREAGAGESAILVAIGLVLASAATLNRGHPGPVATDPVSGDPPDARPARRRRRVPRRLLVLGLLCALAFMVENGFELWSAVYLEDTLGASAAVGGLGPGVFMGAIFAGRMLAQWRGDRVPDALLVALSGLAAAAGAVVAILADTPAVALAGIALAGLGIAAAAPTMFSLAGRGVSDQARGTAISTVAVIGYAGFVLSPALVGGVAGVADLRTGLLVLAAAALALAAGARLARVVILARR